MSKSRREVASKMLRHEAKNLVRDYLVTVSYYSSHGLKVTDIYDIRDVENPSKEDLFYLLVIEEIMTSLEILCNHRPTEIVAWIHSSNVLPPFRGETPSQFMLKSRTNIPAVKMFLDQVLIYTKELDNDLALPDPLGEPTTLSASKIDYRLNLDEWDM